MCDKEIIMDTELFKMLLTVINQVIDKLPVGVTGIIVTILGGYALHRWKRLPYKIVRVGVNGSTTVTADMLAANCDKFHLPLDVHLKAQTSNINTLVNNQVIIQAKVSDIAEDMGYIKGQLRELSK